MARNRQQDLAQTQKAEVMRREKEVEQQQEHFLPTVDISETPVC